jgi:hypothetical protein
MANTKISALGAATTPVAGTEVLPIVQSSTTVKLAISDITPGLSTITAVKGGTGQTSYAVGDLLYANTTTTLAKLADVATGNALISGGVGVAPSWGKVGLTTHVSGTLPTANGGTNLTSFTANGVVYASSSSALATGTALNFNGTNLLVARTNPTFYGGAANFGVEQTSGSSWGIGVNANGNAVVFNHTANTSSSVGGIAVTTSSTSYVTSSDYRLKNTIAPMTGALAKVAQLKPVTYKWNVDGSDGQGFIAHELAEVCPDAVTGEKDGTRIEQYEISPAIDATYDENGNELTAKIEAVMGERVVPSYQGIDVSFLVATLTAAIQELKAEFDAYKATHS